MDSDVKRRMVTVDQLHSLLEFMKGHPELAWGLSRGRRGKLMTVKVWNTCANKLNAMGDGAVKDGKGWSKYWCDWKYRVRRHALEIKVARDTNKQPPESITPLSPVEETIMAIIGDSSIEGVVVKSDPLLDEDSDEEGVQETNENDGTNSRTQEGKKGVEKRRRMSAAEVVPDDTDDDDVTSPPPRRPRLHNVRGSDSEEDHTTRFLHLEKMQLENAKKIHESICQISLEICRLTDIMGEIRDVLVKKLDHVT